MGEHISLSTLANPKKETDLIEVLDKIQKLVDSPLGKMVMARFSPPEKDKAEVRTVYKEVPGPAVGVQPRTPVHEKIFTLLNTLEEAQLETMFEKFAPEGTDLRALLG